MNKMTKTITCTCTSSYQDQRYGVGKRLGNLIQKGMRDRMFTAKYRCTICQKEGD